MTYILIWLVAICCACAAFTAIAWLFEIGDCDRDFPDNPDDF